ncbi:hypothetical protein NL676_013749 [Syzygium grande]|nr:hypothetical protein NL676_013749 [Syzygium grande]
MGTGQGKAKDHSPRRVKGQTAACTKATKFVKEVNGHDDDDWLSSKYHADSQGEARLIPAPPCPTPQKFPDPSTCFPFAG